MCVYIQMCFHACVWIHKCNFMTVSSLIYLVLQVEIWKSIRDGAEWQGWALIALCAAKPARSEAYWYRPNGTNDFVFVEPLQAETSLLLLNIHSTNMDGLGSDALVGYKDIYLINVK